MRIPVFVSCPTSLSERQEAARGLILAQLDDLGLEPRAVGRSDYPTELPLREVLILIRHCAGGVILGFEQYRSHGGIERPETVRARKVDSVRPLPTPWNHIEAGLLLGASLPTLIFREDGITGGVFDPGVTTAFVHHMPEPSSEAAKSEIEPVFLKWQAEVRNRYYAL